MKFIKKVEFANFTCIFGEKLPMIYLFDEVVWPSFDEIHYRRIFKDSEYFFINTQLIKVNNGSTGSMLCLSGRLVKNTKLKRDQVFRQGKGIVEDHNELETAPSSLFVLILNNHRLLFVREVPGAPDISAFRTTCYQFLKKRHEEFIDELIDKNMVANIENNSSAKQTKKTLIKKYPYPDLRITLLTDPQELHAFIQRFELIEELNIKLLKTNQEEINNDDFWLALDDRRERMDSVRTRLQFANKKEGLNEPEVYDQCNSASNLGNSAINLKGYDHLGDKLKGNNDDFHLSKEIKDLTRNVSNATPILVKLFTQLIDSGVIQIPKISQSIAIKISELTGRFF